jgi:hypothetical protein
MWDTINYLIIQHQIAKSIKVLDIESTKLIAWEGEKVIKVPCIKIVLLFFLVKESTIN